MAPSGGCGNFLLEADVISLRSSTKIVSMLYLWVQLLNTWKFLSTYIWVSRLDGEGGREGGRGREMKGDEERGGRWREGRQGRREGQGTVRGDRMGRWGGEVRGEGRGREGKGIGRKGEG